MFLKKKLRYPMHPTTDTMWSTGFNYQWTTNISETDNADEPLKEYNS